MRNISREIAACFGLIDLSRREPIRLNLAESLGRLYIGPGRARGCERQFFRELQDIALLNACFAGARVALAESRSAGSSLFHGRLSGHTYVGVECKESISSLSAAGCPPSPLHSRNGSFPLPPARRRRLLLRNLPSSA